MKKIILLSLSMMFAMSCAPRVVVAEPAHSKVVIVKTPPKQYRVVRLNGKRYYKWNGKHYRKTRRGYVFVKI